MKTSERMKKFLALKDSDLQKEISVMQLSILNLRIDIANHKTKGIHKIAQIKSDIARAKTILNGRLKENNGGE